MDNQNPYIEEEEEEEEEEEQTKQWTNNDLQNTHIKLKIE